MRDASSARARPDRQSVFEIGDRMIDKLTEGWAPSDIATLNDLLARLARNAVGFARGLEAIEPATHGTPRAGQAGPEG